MMLRATFLIALLLAFAGGCQSDRKPRLSGTITLDGAPLGDAEVQLIITPNNQPTAVSGGWTDATGKYEIRHVTPRTYRVAIRKFLHKDGTPYTRNEMIMIRPGSVKGLTAVVPAVYSDPKESKLTVDVKDMKQVADFDLTSKP